MDTSRSAGDPGATRGGYRPIDCDLHDQLELAAMHRQELIVEWQEDAGEAHTGHVRVLDLETRPDGEFLIGQLRSGSPVELRLDRVIRFGPP